MYGEYEDGKGLRGVLEGEISPDGWVAQGHFSHVDNQGKAVAERGGKKRWGQFRFTLQQKQNPNAFTGLWSWHNGPWAAGWNARRQGSFTAYPLKYASSGKPKDNWHPKRKPTLLSAPWSGTWTTPSGELRLLQVGERVYGDYDRQATTHLNDGVFEGKATTARRLRGVHAWLNPQTNRVVKSQTGLLQLNLSGLNAYKGKFEKGRDNEPKNAWNGTRVSPVAGKIWADKGQPSLYTSSAPEVRDWINGDAWAGANAATQTRQQASNPAPRATITKREPAGPTKQRFEVLVTHVYVKSGETWVNRPKIYGWVDVKAFADSATSATSVKPFGAQSNRVFAFSRKNPYEPKREFRVAQLFNGYYPTNDACKSLGNYGQNRRTFEFATADLNDTSKRHRLQIDLDLNERDGGPGGRFDDKFGRHKEDIYLADLARVTANWTQGSCVKKDIHLTKGRSKNMYVRYQVIRTTAP